MTRKKPWNRIDAPVYSVSSFNETKNNMNICTYVTAISMHPKRFVVGIYKNTCTLTNVMMHPKFILQLLSFNQYRLVNLLGKSSGTSIDKITKLKAPLMMWNEFHVLQEACALIHLSVIEWIDAGDHWATICEVIAYKNMNDTLPLTLNDLRLKKIIRG